MSAGKRFKFKRAISMMTGFSATDITITAISQANPAVVTATAHGLTDGDVVQLSEIVGMTELNGGTYVVNSTGANAFELVGVDSSGYTAYASAGVANEGVFSMWCELVDYNRQGGSSPEIPASTQCSTAQEFEIGLPDYGTTQIQYNFAPRTAIQLALKTAYDDATLTAVKISLPSAGGEMTQLGYIQQMSEQGATNGLWTANLTMRNTGARYDVPV